jgi:hypothetical protein
MFPAGYDFAHKVMLHTGTATYSETRFVRLSQFPDGNRTRTKDSPNWTRLTGKLPKGDLDA